MIKLRWFLLTALVGLLGVTSCTEEIIEVGSETENPSQDGHATVQLTFKGIGNPARSYAEQTHTTVAPRPDSLDCVIDSVMIYVFNNDIDSPNEPDDNAVLENITKVMVEAANTMDQYAVKTTFINKGHKWFVAVANGTDTTAINEGMLYAEFKKQCTPSAQSLPVAPFYMSGMEAGTLSSETPLALSIELTRAVTRIDLVIRNNEGSKATNPFVLQEVRISNANSKSYLLWNSDGSGSFNEPADTRFTSPWTDVEAIVKKGAAADSLWHYLYTYETLAKTNEQLTLEMKGLFNGVASHYKFNLTRDANDKTNPVTPQRNLIRNHRYLVYIDSVSLTDIVGELKVGDWESAEDDTISYIPGVDFGSPVATIQDASNYNITPGVLIGNLTVDTLNVAASGLDDVIINVTSYNVYSEFYSDADWITAVKEEVPGYSTYASDTTAVQQRFKVTIASNGKTNQRQGHFEFRNPIAKARKARYAVKQQGLAEIVSFPLQLSEAVYNSDNTYYLLNDNESNDILFNQNERSFYVNQPLQVTFTDDHQFRFRFYCPRAITNVTIWAKIEGYDEAFKFAELQKIMPLQQFSLHIPFTTETLTAYTRSGKQIEITSNPNFNSADITFEIESSNPVYTMMTTVIPKWKIAFGHGSGDYVGDNPNWGYLKPIHAREAVALTLNMATLFSTAEFEEEAEKYRGKLINSGKEVSVDDVKQKAWNHSRLNIGRVTGAVAGLGGGATFGLAEYVFLEMYVDDAGYNEIAFHEFAHCMGYGHDGNMTYDSAENPGWVTLCEAVFKTLGAQKRLPIYSRRFLNSRASRELVEETGKHGSSWHPFEDDAELNAIDGGLSLLKGQTDTGGNNGAALTFTLDYTHVPGATATTFRPKDVHVYGDIMYVVNDATDNYSLEIFNIANGNINHLKTIKSWDRNGVEGTFVRAPHGVTRANGRIYVTDPISRTEIFDAQTYQYITCIGTGQWGSWSMQTYDALDVLQYKGVIVIRESHRISFVEESRIWPGATMYVFTRTEEIGYKVAAYGMAINEQDGLLYSSNQAQKSIDAFDISALRVWITIPRKTSVAYKNNPYSLDFYQGRMFVSSDGTEKFSEVDPATGNIIKDYTTIGSITLQLPEKFCIRRNTLFIVNRTSGQEKIHAIPITQLN